MSILNNCTSSSGLPAFPLKGAGNQDANQHCLKSLQLHGAHSKKPLQQNSSLKNTASNGDLLYKTPDTSFLSKKQCIEDLSQLLTNKKQTHPPEFETLFMGPPLQFDKEQVSSAITEAAATEPLHVSTAPNVVLAVSVSSAVELNGRQAELIARKMKRLTGFTNLRLQNIIDPSLIAGFVISYGPDDGSQVIDLSVKGQLATLAARVESSDKWRHSHGEN